MNAYQIASYCRLVFLGWAAVFAGSVPAANETLTKADCVFDWAERAAPTQFFPAAKSQTSPPYYYRYYAGTQSYLGIYTAEDESQLLDHVLYLGPLYDQKPLDVGPIAGLLQATGCGDGVAASGSVTATLDNDRAVSATVSATSGGTLQTIGADGTRYTLTIPNNALLVDTAIRMTPLAAIANLPVSGGFRAGVMLEPEGAKFANHLSLSIEPVAPLPATNQIGFTFQSAGANAHLFPLQPATATSFSIQHFSSYALAKGAGADVAAQAARPASSDQAAWEQRTAERIYKAYDSGDSAAVLQAYAEAYADYANNYLGPRMAAAAQSDSMEYIADVMAEALAYENRMELMPIDGKRFSNELLELMKRQAALVKAVWCANSANPGEYLNVLMLSTLRSLTLLGMDDLMNPKDCMPAWKGTSKVVLLSGQRIFKQFTSEITFVLDSTRSTAAKQIYAVGSGSMTFTQPAVPFDGKSCGTTAASAKVPISRNDAVLEIDTINNTYRAWGYANNGENMYAYYHLDPIPPCPGSQARTSLGGDLILAADKDYPIDMAGTSFSGSSHAETLGITTESSWSFVKQ